MLDNLNTKIWCRLADDRTAAEATEGLGLCTVRLPDDGVGLSYGGVGGLSGNAQRRLAAREVPLVRPAWLTALPRGEALVRMKGEVWKLRVPLLTPVPQEMLETLGLSTLWTALDPATVDQRKPLHDEGGGGGVQTNGEDVIPGEEFSVSAGAGVCTPEVTDEGQEE